MLTNHGHLTYCTNIHAGESWQDHFRALQDNFPAIKKNCSPGAPMGIGLRLSNEASLDLEKPESRIRFKEWLKDNEAYVFTMNGFPYGGFHHIRVKDQVHAPDWTTRQRVEYTLRLFRILEGLLPEEMDGGISTSPLSYRRWFTDPDNRQSAKETATAHILEVVEFLIHTRHTGGKYLHLDIEPEPDGLLETGQEFMEWLENDLLPAGIPRISAKFAISASAAASRIKEHLRLCYDVCHFSIGYEPHAEVIRQLSEKGIKIGKIQISAALKKETGPVAQRTALKDAFLKYQEGVYLHQVIAKRTDGELLRYPDLPEALADYENPLVAEWRAHFHVPVFAEDFGAMQSTQDDIIRVLQIQQNDGITQHLEVETYTWEVLPAELKLPIQESIIRELNWVKEQLDRIANKPV
jgi:hypothetical protein